MTSSEAPSASGTIELRVHAEPFVEVQILDERLGRVDAPGLGSFSVRVPCGAYAVSFRVGNTSEQVVAGSLEAGAVVDVATPSVLPATSAPLYGTSSKHEYQTYPARDLSTGPALPIEPARGPRGRLFLFVRDPDGAPSDARTQQIGLGLQVVDGPTRGAQVLFDLAHAVRHGDQLWAGQALEVPAGTYRLRHLRVGSDARAGWEQSIVVAAQWTTQAFFVTRDDGAADPRSMSVMMSPPGMGFEPGSDDLRRAELALAALSRGARLRGVDRNAMLAEKFQSPMLGLYAAHLLVQGEVTNVDLAVEVIGNLHQLLGPIADVTALRLGLRMKTNVDALPAEPVAPLDAPPMLYKSWKRWVQADQREPGLIPTDSPGDRIATSAVSSGPWLTWRAGALERPLDTSSVSQDLASTLTEASFLVQAGPAVDEASDARRFPELRGVLEQRLARALVEIDASRPAVEQLDLRVPRSTAARAAASLVQQLSPARAR